MVSMVTIGKVLATHGVRGEVKVRSYSDVPGRFEGLKEVATDGPHGVQTLRVLAVRQTAEEYLLKFKDVETPEMAKVLIGSYLQIREEPLTPPSADEYYECQLVGMNVQTEKGFRLGVLKEVVITRSNAVFVVEDAHGAEHLIPGTKEIVRSIDVEARRMIIRPLPGLLREEPCDAL